MENQHPRNISVLASPCKLAGRMGGRGVLKYLASHELCWWIITFYIWTWAFLIESGHSDLDVHLWSCGQSYKPTSLTTQCLGFSSLNSTKHDIVQTLFNFTNDDYDDKTLLETWRTRRRRSLKTPTPRRARGESAVTSVRKTNMTLCKRYLTLQTTITMITLYW